MTGARATTSWHVPDEMLAAYVGERVGEADAWSVESHLTCCAGCRVRLAQLVAVSPVAVALARSRAELIDALPRPDRSAQHPVLARLSSASPLPSAARSLGRWPWLVAVVLAAGTALAVSWLAGVLRPSGAQFPLNWALAPVLPLAGVVLTWTRRSDPWAEVVLSTPNQGLVLVGWRCVSVLVVSAPMAFVVGHVPGVDHGGLAVSGGMSLLAMLALTLLSLALGTRIGPEAAVVVVAAGWSTITVFPLLVADQAFVAATAPESWPAWAAIIALSAWLVVLRRNAFEQLPSRGLRVPATS